jgi:hypothetical protein
MEIAALIAVVLFVIASFLFAPREAFVGDKKGGTRGTES